MGDGGLTRRSLVAAGGAAVVLGATPGWARKRVPLARGGSFASGVAAGVPRSGSASLWTRVHDVEGPARVRWEVARDRGFRKVVRSGELVAGPDADFTAKPRASGLSPGREYWYRFETATASSEPGRLRTLPPPGSAQPVRIGFWTCQDFRVGFYPAHRALADEDLDLVVCLGDFIYETGGPSSLPGRDDLTGANRDGSATRLDDYRAKYRLYRTDGDLRKLSSSHAIAALWDDHEVANNYWRDGQDGRTSAGFAARKSAAYRAWFEHMPIPHSRAGGTQLYRVLRLGRTVEVIVMDDRQYRDPQPCGDVGLSPCPDASNPSRSMLGAEQKRWLKDVTKASDATWKVLANGVMMMGLDQPAPGSPKFVDTWDGYAAERAELVSFWLREGVEDVVVMTGDDHDNYAGVVTPTGHSGAPAGAVEFVVPSVTSQNTSEILGGAAAGSVSEENARALNSHLALVDQVRHGYCVLEARPDSVEVEFKHAATIARRDAAVNASYRFRVPRGTARVERLS